MRMPSATESMVRTVIMVSVLLAVAAGSGAQGTLTAQVEPSGTVRVSAGGAELAMIELNAHASGWKHVPQASATAQVTDLPNGAGKRITGTLPIGEVGGALSFTQTVKPIAQGLQLEYDVSVAQTVTLNGLQISICLPTARFAGKELLIGQLDRDPEYGSFPQELNPQNSQVWSGAGERVEAARGTPEAVAARLRAATDIIVQDLRQWKHETFEIRFPAIMEGGGREVTPNDRFHLDFTVTFAAAVKLAGQ